MRIDDVVVNASPLILFLKNCEREDFGFPMNS
jgi:hypothetical protein